jgi:hypothetical protein
MPNYETAVFAASKPDRANPSRLAPPNNASGNVEFVRCKYTILGTEQAGELIKLCILPVEAIPLPQLSSAYNAVTGAFVVDIGTAADPDGWADGLALTAAGRKEFTSSSPAPAWLEPTPIVADVGSLNKSGSAEVYATIVTATTPTAGVVIQFLLAYIKQK